MTTENKDTVIMTDTGLSNPREHIGHLIAPVREWFILNTGLGQYAIIRCATDGEFFSVSDKRYKPL